MRKEKQNFLAMGGSSRCPSCRDLHRVSKKNIHSYYWL